MIFVKVMVARHEFIDADIATAYGAHAAAQITAAKDAWEADRPFVDRFITSLPVGGSILDVGSGSGNQARYFVEHGLEVSMTDGTAEMLSVAQQQVPQAQARVGILPDIPFENDQFDGVFSRHVLHHLSLPSFEASLRNIYRVLRTGGHLGLILAVSADSTVRQGWWNIGSDDHVQINHYPVSSVRKLFEQLRFVAIEGRIRPVPEADSSVLSVISKK